MIARTVALTLTVKNVERSRQSLEELLRATAATLHKWKSPHPTPEGEACTPPCVSPAASSAPCWRNLKGYGKVANETQTGEEVGQQHADLAARLNTSRESEERLRGILKTRTGDVSEVLQVEREIARVREQIESMEAEQQALEHRIVYATVELQMLEEGQAPSGETVAARLAAGARQGWENATETGLGLTVFLLQYGLATLLLAVVLGIPIWLAWRRWSKPPTPAPNEPAKSGLVSRSAEATECATQTKSEGQRPRHTTAWADAKGAEPAPKLRAVGPAHNTWAEGAGHGAATRQRAEGPAHRCRRAVWSSGAIPQNLFKPPNRLKMRNRQ